MTHLFNLNVQVVEEKLASTLIAIAEQDGVIQHINFDRPKKKTYNFSKRPNPNSTLRETVLTFFKGRNNVHRSEMIKYLKTQGYAPTSLNATLGRLLEKGEARRLAHGVYAFPAASPSADQVWKNPSAL